MRKQAPTMKEKYFHINNCLYDCRVAFARVVGEKAYKGTLRFYPKERPTKVGEIGLTRSWNKSPLIGKSNRPTFAGSHHYPINGL